HTHREGCVDLRGVIPGREVFELERVAFDVEARVRGPWQRSRLARTCSRGNEGHGADSEADSREHHRRPYAASRRTRNAMPVARPVDSVFSGVDAVDEGSITRARSVLHLSQPAVSAHIKAMEDALGLSLFERTTRGMSLTSDGQRLLAKAEQKLAAHQELMA